MLEMRCFDSEGYSVINKNGKGPSTWFKDISMETLCFIPQLVAPIEALFIASPSEFDELHNDIKFLLCNDCTRKLLKNLQPQT